MCAERKRLIIAIDGTAGAGKTTIGQMLAAYLDCSYLDTGAMYRAVAWLAVARGVKDDDHATLSQFARELDFEARPATPAEAADGRQYTVLVAGSDVSQDLRSPEVEAHVSPVAAIPEVRSELVKKQRELARQNSCFVMIGRDIGSVVLPQADLKVYLDASAAVRAQRRSQQNTGSTTQIAQAQQIITERDRIDSGRSTSPLIVAQGALYINTDELTKDEVFERIKAAISSL